MTPTDEARFIELWQQGTSYADIAQAMQLKLGTVASRASTLVRQGKIQPRPRGGAYPKQKALARQEGTPPPVSTPVQCSLLTLDQCSGSTGWKTRSRACVNSSRPCLSASTTPQCRHRCRSRHYPHTRRGKPCAGTCGSCLDAIKEQISTLAAERDLSPGELVQEYLWKALTDRSSSTP